MADLGFLSTDIGSAHDLIGLSLFPDDLRSNPHIYDGMMGVDIPTLEKKLKVTEAAREAAHRFILLDVNGEDVSEAQMTIYEARAQACEAEWERDLLELYMAKKRIPPTVDGSNDYKALALLLAEADRELVKAWDGQKKFMTLPEKRAALKEALSATLHNMCNSFESASLPEQFPNVLRFRIKTDDVEISFKTQSEFERVRDLVLKGLKPLSTRKLITLWRAGLKDTQGTFHWIFEAREEDLRLNTSTIDVIRRKMSEARRRL